MKICLYYSRGPGRRSVVGSGKAQAVCLWCIRYSFGSHLQILKGEVRNLSSFDGFNQWNESAGKVAAFVRRRQPRKQSIGRASDFERILDDERRAEMNTDGA